MDNWATAQTVTVTAEEDDDAVTDAGVTLTHTVSGGGYGSTTVPDVEVSITENDSAGIVISKDSLTVGEGDAAGSTYTVKLATQPSGSVSVAITGHAGTDLTLDKTTLTFTVDNWDTAQTVTVKAGQDNDGSADTATLTHTASGGDYANITVDLPVTVTDDDEPDVVLSETDLTVTEGDAAGSSYTVRLATEPSGSVSVAITGHAGTDLSLSGTTLSSNMLTFTVDNWDTAQTVTVKAGQDDDGANDTATLTHTASGGDYASITAALPVTVTDDDTAGVTIEPTTLSVVAGRSNEYTVRLANRALGRGHRDRLRPCWHGRDAGQDDADLRGGQLGHSADGHRISYSERRHSEGYPGARHFGGGLRFRHCGAGGRLGSGCCRSAAYPSGRGELIGADPDGT